MIKSKYNKTQIGMEFFIITALLLFLFVTFFVAIEAHVSERSREKEEIFIKDLALSIKDEIDLATKATDGYIREFNVPENIYGKDYGITIIKEGEFPNIYINTSRNAISFPIADVEGNIIKGTNTIRKENGTVYLNE